MNHPHNPVDWTDVCARVEALIAESYPTGSALPTLVDALAAHLRRAATSWPLLIDYSRGPLDRRADLLSAPLYTSARHPWPREGDRWCEPVLQIDLQRWGKLAGRDVGRGLLQLWDPQTGGMIRVIPPLDLAQPTAAVPSHRGEDYATDISDIDPETGRSDWLDRPGRIASFGQEFFDVAPWHLLRHIRIIADPEYDGEATEPPALRSSLLALLTEIGKPDTTDVHRAFGMCGGNVYIEADNLPPVLLTVESDERIFTTMGSTLCVCVEQVDDQFSYSAHLFWE